MEIIYIDLHFMINLLTDYLLCLAAGRFCGLRLKRLRYLLSALLGAVYSVLIFLPGAGLLTLPAVKLLCAMLMGYIAYGGEEHPLRCTLAFLAVSMAFGGTVWALSMAGGVSVLPLSLKTLFFSFALSYAVLSLFFRSRAKLAEKPLVSVKLDFMGKTTEFTALLDSGNSLSDPVSGSSVMLVCPHALKPVFPALPQLSAVEMLEYADQSDALRGRFRLVPYSAVDGSGLLAAFRADMVSIDGTERSDILVAIAPNAHGEGFLGIV